MIGGDTIKRIDFVFVFCLESNAESPTELTNEAFLLV